MSVEDELRQARWFGGKSRTIVEVRGVDRALWVDESELRIVEVWYAEGSPETYVLAERLDDPAVARSVLRRFAGADILTQAGGSLVFRPGRLFAQASAEPTEPIAVMRAEQSNTSVRFGDALMLKLLRRLQFGPNPDVEVGRFLTEYAAFDATPAVVGSLDYTSPSGEVASLAMLQRFVPNRGDAWSTTLGRLEGVLDGATMADSLDSIARLGRTTAELHLALASGDRDFSPEPIELADLDSWQRVITDEVRLAVEALARLDIDVGAARLLGRAGGITALAGAQKARQHGDYHLGQVLERKDGSFVIIDFEGEPSKPLAQRREKHSPLRDVAGLLRSLDYARHAALRARGQVDQAQVRRLADWHAAARGAFLASHRETISGRMPALLPADVASALAALELQKAAYEVLYELNNRPDWLPIPLAALQAGDPLSNSTDKTG